ncbi:MAG TPA: hypothetical protein VGR61_02515, partial [Candidatus Dormibacteraeota bacterium]|nr:hypothetical protein [Candidatus Dormibacteraeota bacterium]
AATTTTNADGTHTIQAKAGASSAHVELDEMFPGGPATAGCPQFQPQCWKGSLTVTAGDKVIWTYTGAKNVHTVTFPQGTGSNGVDPFKPTVCEGTGSVDPPPALPGPPPFFGCLNMKPEQPLDPAPHGPSAIADGTTVATSGILGSSPSPFPQSHAFTFPNVNAGLTYQCRIHDNMIGVVQVLAAAIVPPTPALPKAGHDMRRAIPAGNTGIVLVFAVLALIALLPAARFAIRKRR